MLSNQTTIREKNIHLVLSQIINHPEISRAEISKKTGLNKATVSEIVRNLIHNQYVIETGTGESSDVGGRKPILLKINKKAGISFSFDVRFDQISYMISYLNGEVVNQELIEMNIDSTNIVSIIKNIVSNFESNIGQIPFGIIGIALAIHGITSNNQIMFTPYYDLSQIDLAKILQTELNIPVYLENEANLGALAEATFDKSHQNLITCSIHTGVGAGIMINKKLYHGYQGRSGEIGHTTLYPNGLQCPCGNKGCLEQYCSHNALLYFYRTAMQNQELTLQDLINDFKKSEDTAVAILKEFAKNLSIGMINLMGTYGPEIIYINSQIIRELPILLKWIQDHLSQTIYKNIPIEKSKISKNASLYGATVMNIQNFFKIDSLQLSLN